MIDWIFCPGLHGYFQIPMVKHPTGPGPHFDFRMFHVEILWMEEILHQLIGGKHGGLSDLPGLYVESNLCHIIQTYKKCLFICIFLHLQKIEDLVPFHQVNVLIYINKITKSHKYP